MAEARRRVKGEGAGFADMLPAMRRDDTAKPPRSERLRWIHAVMVAATAIVSVSPYHPDEHFQIVEYAGYKLGLVPREWLTWEYAEHMRPWLFPGAVYLVLRALRALHFGDLFTQLTVVRLLCAALGFWSLDALIRRSRDWLPAEILPAQEAALRLVGFLPWLFARPCSETVASSLFVLALTRFVAPPAPATGPRSRPRRASSTLFASGLLAGAAFEVRYQTAILAVSLVGWALAVEKRPRRELVPFVGGFVAMLAVGTLVDAWGYGGFVLAPVRYFQVNLLQGAASRFSTSPPWFYFVASLANVFAPSVLLALLAMVVLAVRFPKHVLTWMLVPFFAVHSLLLAHKEDRFLWPIAIFAAAAIVPAFYPGGPQAPGAWFFDSIWAIRRTRIFRVLVAVNVATALFVALVPVNGAEHGLLARAVYRTVPPGATLYVQDTDITEYNLYRRDWNVRKLQEGVCCPFEGTAPSFVLTTHTRAPLGSSSDAELLYTEWPLGSFDALFGRLVGQLPSLRPPPLQTLYRVTPRAACDAALPPCADGSRPPAYVTSPLRGGP